MANVRSAAVRGASSLSPARVDQQIPLSTPMPVQPRQAFDEPENRSPDASKVDPTSALIAGFAAPSPKTAAWLANPRLGATLEAASEALAPGGVTEDPVDRYAASVIETHLVARKRLSKLMNSLLKT